MSFPPCSVMVLSAHLHTAVFFAYLGYPSVASAQPYGSVDQARLSNGAIAGIVVACGFGLLCYFLAAIFVRRRRRVATVETSNTIEDGGPSIQLPSPAFLRSGRDRPMYERQPSSYDVVISELTPMDSPLPPPAYDGASDPPAYDLVNFSILPVLMTLLKQSQRLAPFLEQESIARRVSLRYVLSSHPGLNLRSLN
ncbi:hypothetical protein BD626DRAFT_20104 [Schizophyllum amplum]|uniref:Transmembrane protein n=1 Tax=Schizophyllum amplum TaxID=97359 RepID=A0A550CYQ5_9AGAR|nr:hypothetical protein BD626DRAFT_20104 [Auriculariopsis ampla]